MAGFRATVSWLLSWLFVPFVAAFSLSCLNGRFALQVNIQRTDASNNRPSLRKFPGKRRATSCSGFCRAPRAVDDELLGVVQQQLIRISSRDTTLAGHDLEGFVSRRAGFLHFVV